MTLSRIKHVRAFVLRGGGAVPEKGSLRASALDRPGFGVELNRDIPLHRPYTH